MYRPDDPHWSFRIVQDNPLAILSTNGTDAPVLTHLPMVPDPIDFPRPDDPQNRLARDRRLIGHLNRANPHCAALTDGIEAVAVFHGPHGYVSPTLYDSEIAAPTWNFTAVHVRGRIEMLHGTGTTLDVVRTTVTALESRFGDGWDECGSLDYFRRILAGVQAFRLHVVAVDSMAKLSQEKTAEVRLKVAAALERSERGSRRELAAMMHATTATQATGRASAISCTSDSASSSK
ncbi:hypothetical protein Val02_11290 [Virgisporangium aliadipatigenens]|uniref:FMN-binding negative transcriptional regulator n=1 Tax=Virgisporangium aliadipatigenens TaxID=741659 RepID=A0A8J3YHW6_9ACTN|nr:FMN-binding negative transcriptional regulator [Virgisporangium aliadipatigenens]GIJ44243.1 hypothetical protein Val02_11290 [Virgisporangium aliadipatigenens]